MSRKPSETSINNLVPQLLAEDPKLGTNDYALFESVIDKQKELGMGIDLDMLSARGLLKLLKEGEVIHFESLRRCRQKSSKAKQIRTAQPVAGKKKATKSKVKRLLY